MADCFIYDHVRTPRGRGKKDGSLHEVTAIQLCETVLTGLKEKSDIDTSLIEDVVLGCVDPVGEAGGDIARAAVIAADYPENVPGMQINRFCASGLDATNMAASQIMSGMNEVSIGGGVEAMSRLGIFSSGGAWPLDPSVALPSYFVPQGVSADLIATKYGFSREACDEFAVESQKRAQKAWANEYFKDAIVPVKDINGLTLLDHDEHMRKDVKLEDLAKLNPSFEQQGKMGGFDHVALTRYPEIESMDHVHHAGNSSGIVDGAALVLMGSKAAGKKLGLKPRAKIKAFANIGSEPCIMLTGPSTVAQKALKKAGLKASDIDLWEINEAFSSVVLHAMNELKIDHDKVNVNGGAIAMGHPLGATGAILVGTLLDELERRDLKRGLVTMCIGAGMGTATIIERV